MTRTPTISDAFDLSGELLPGLVESALEQGAEARFEVDGHSMMPLIRPGDIVHVGRPADAGPRPGDVVAVRVERAGGMLVHRVVRRKNGVATLRGDNAAQADGEFAEREILGVVTRVERNGHSTWFGAGRWGALVGPAVGVGAVRRFNRMTFPVYRWIRARRRGA
jgi:signal peptidase I